MYTKFPVYWNYTDPPKHFVQIDWTEISKVGRTEGKELKTLTGSVAYKIIWDVCLCVRIYRRNKRFVFVILIRMPVDV